MLFHVRYLNKSLDRDDSAELLKAFGDRGEAPGTQAHYVAADGSGGFTIVDTDDVEGMYRSSMVYGEWLDIEITPVLPVADAVPIIVDELERG